MKNNKDEKQEETNTIKVGTFQLQTKSFWISLVAILCLFMLSIVWINSFYWNKICNNLITLTKEVVELKGNVK